MTPPEDIEDLLGVEFTNNPWPPPRYCLFDTSVSLATEKLPDAFILELILLNDYANPGTPELARMFELDTQELYAFLHPFHWRHAAEAPATSWIDTLHLTGEDSEDLSLAATASSVKSGMCEEHRMSYIDHTYDVLVTLSTAMDRKDATSVPGIDTLEELQTAWEFYNRGAKVVLELLSRAYEEDE